MRRPALAATVLLGALVAARPAVAFESPLAAATYVEGVGYSNGGGGAHRLRGVGVDWISYMDEFWVVVGTQILAPATEADRSGMTAATLRWGFVAAEAPDPGGNRIDPLMGFLEVTANLLHVSLENETRNGLGAGIRLGVYGLLPPKGVLYYRIAAAATGGHLVTTDDAFALLCGEVSLGLVLAP